MAIPCQYRGFALVLMGVAWLAVLLRLSLSIDAALAAGQGVGWGLVLYLGFFTVLTNILVSIAVTASLLAPQTHLGAYSLRPRVATALAVYIVVVGLAYFFLLRNAWDPRGWVLVADVLLHYVVPALFVVYWWLAIPKDRLRWRDVSIWLLYPAAYLVYVLVRGEILGIYPYPFLDVATLGYGPVLFNSGLLLVGFAIVALAFTGVGRWQARLSGEDVG